MTHRLSTSRYLVLLAVMLTAAVGDTLLSHGMTEVGAISPHHLGRLLDAMRNPWVITGTLCLIGFFASYLSALSWADLTFVLPSTAFGYVVVALLSHIWLQEQISPARWIGIVLIVCGVGFVANGPALTERASPEPSAATPSLPESACSLAVTSVAIEESEATHV